MLKELYKSIRTYIIKQRLLDERVLWNDVWWSLLEYGNTIHLRENLSEKTLSTMDSISSEIVSRFRQFERNVGMQGKTDDVTRTNIMRCIKDEQ